MSDAQIACTCVIDTSGLHALASSSGNLKSVLLDQMKKGAIAVPVCVWQEFGLLYEDEAAEIESCVSTKIKMNKTYRNGAARIAEKLNAGFSRGPNDRHTDLYTASIASSKNCVVLTCSSQLNVYREMDCEVFDLTSWVEELGSTKRRIG